MYEKKIDFRRNKKILRVILFYFILFFVNPVLAVITTTENGWCVNDNPISIKYSLGTKLLYKKSCAIVISASNYKNPSWEQLKYTSKEADELADTLSKQEFDVLRLSDANSMTLHHVFNSIIPQAGDKETRLIVYFTGHGWTDANNTIGYAIPVDAPAVDSKDLLYRSAVSTSDIKKSADLSIVRHLLFVVDSCYSAALFITKGGLSPQKVATYSELESLLRKSRFFITATERDVRAPGVSVFTKQFIKGIVGEANKLNDSFISASELSVWLRKTVPRMENGTMPQSGDIGSGGGETLFIPSSGAVNLKLAKAESAVVNAEGVVNKENSSNSLDWNNVDLIYYRKNTDGTRIINVLDESGIKFSSTRNNNLENTFSTNTIACNKNGSINHVKDLAILLIENNIPIFEIQQFKSNNKPKSRVELLASARYSQFKATPLTIKQVKDLHSCPVRLRNLIKEEVN